MRAGERKLLVLEAIKYGAKTAREIGERLGINPSHVSSYLNYYRRQNLVKIVGVDGEGRGRKSYVYELTERGRERIERLRGKL